MNNQRMRIFILAVVVALAIGLYFLVQSGTLARLTGQKPPIYIAVVSPKNDPNSYPQAENAAKLMVSELENGILGHPVLVDYYYDDDDPKAVAEQIVADGRAMAVIGHVYSGASIAAGEIYAKAGIPAITGSATVPSVTRDNPWFFGVINSNESYGGYTALYINDVLGVEKASIVYENDDYGKTLADAFEQRFTRMGGTIQVTKSMDYYDADDPAGQAQAEKVVGEIIKETEDPGIIFLILYKNEGYDFINAMRGSGKSWALFGAEDLGDNDFARLFNSPNATEGMYAFSPLIYDVAGLEAQEFKDRYHQAYGIFPTWFGATTYDSIHVAAEAIRRANISGEKDDLAQDREQVRNALSAIDSPRTAVASLTGQVFFNKDRNFVNPVSFGYFSRGKFISAPLQLQPILDKRLVSEFDSLLQSGKVLQYGSEYLFKTNVVYVGININDVTQVDVDEARQYTIDFYLWFRAKGDIAFDQIEFTNSVEPVTLEDPIAELDFDDGTRYHLYRIKADFTNAFDLQNYPFDRQSLEIKFKHSNLTRENLIYVIDFLGMERVAGAELVAQLRQNKALNAVTDWSAVDANFYIDTIRDYSSLGNPIWFGQEKNVDYSRFNAKIEVVRDVSRFIIKNLLPVLFLISLAYLGLYLPKDNYGEITAIMTGTVLSVVFFHVDLSGRLNVGYSVALDFAFYGVYAILVLITLLSIIAWHRAENEKSVMELFIFMRVLYPAFIIIGGALLLYVYGALPVG